MRLPLAAPATVADTAAVPALSSAHYGPRRLLVADDNRDAAQALAAMLRASGHQVEVAYDGVEALAAAERELPDAALIDIGMPGMDGYEVARRLRALAGGVGVLLIAITGWGAVEDKRRAADAGFDRHLTKPARLEDIESALAGEAPPQRRASGAL